MTQTRGEGLAEYAVVLGVLALGIAAFLVLMRSASGGAHLTALLGRTFGN